MFDVQSLDLGRMAGRTIGTEIIYPGDTLEVLTATGAEQETPASWNLRVVVDGTVNVPLVGPVAVVGANLAQAEHAIRDACMRRRVFRNPIVRVKIIKR
ncbi:MAG: polysaccharide biosynthesis/export family protein, partial [Planctomycetes bacterium]|nr:polysaccharide biosynthesis/export family protein [Planctomycetota bacterium]